MNAPISIPEQLAQHAVQSRKRVILGDETRRKGSVSEALETLRQADMGTDEVAELIGVVGRQTYEFNKRKQLPCTQKLADEASLLQARYETELRNDVDSETMKYRTGDFA